MWEGPPGPTCLPDAKAGPWCDGTHRLRGPELRLLRHPDRLGDGPDGRARPVGAPARADPGPRKFEALTGEAARLGLRPGGLLHVAQSLFHDHVPARRAGLRRVWIHRRHARGGWGATPQPPAPVTADWEFPSMAAFAAAVE